MSKSFISVLFCIFLIAGCSNSAVTDKLLHPDNLKLQVENKRQDIQWTMELEKNRLSDKISTMDYISSSNRLNPQTMLAYEAGRERDSIYPQLDGFGSLNILDTDANAVNLVNNFYLSMSNGQECEKYFDTDSIFSLVLFVNDIKDFEFEKCWWYVGEGFVGEYALEIPVRLVNNTKIADTKVFLKESQEQNGSGEQKASSSSYKIIDIEIENIYGRF